MQDDVQEADGRDHADIYTAIATDCIRYLDLSIEEIDRLTIPEYKLLMHAHNLKAVDEADRQHLQAWLSVAAGATDKKGKPIYKNYEKFFDKEKELERLKAQEDKATKPSRFNAYSRHLKEKSNGNK